MRDELDGRLWTAHHEEFSNGFDRLASKVIDVFRQLDRHHWASPWGNKKEAEAKPRIFAATTALLVSFLVVTGTVTPTGVQARVNTHDSGDFYLA